MQKARRREWHVLVLCGGLLLTVWLVANAAPLLASVTPAVIAAGDQEAAAWNNCTPNHHTPSFGSTVVIASNEVVCQDLTAFGGTLSLHGEIKGAIVAFGSTVMIDGTVNGSIQMYGGHLALQNGSHIHGDIHLYGSSLIRGTETRLDGAIIDHTSQPGWFFGSSNSFSFPFWPLLVWIALGLLLTWLIPEHVMFVSTTAVSKMGRSVVIGLLSIPLAPAVLLILIALVVSIPLAIIVTVGLIAAWALGTVAIGSSIGDYLLRNVAPHYSTRRAQIVVGLTALVLLESLPYIGWLISIGAGLLGLGAVFLSRFGTRLYANPRQPLPL